MKKLFSMVAAALLALFGLSAQAQEMTVRFFDMFFLYIINLNFIAATALGIVCGKSSGFFKSTIRKFIPIRFDDDMGTRSTFCVEPPVTAICEREGQFIVLQIVFADVDVITIGRDIVHWLVF